MADEMKHTPGPWLSYPDDFGTVHGSTHYSVVNDGVITVAYVIAFGNGKEIEAHKANAHLIAAAPELLEALEYALKEMAALDLLRPAQVKAQAAIAKALGEKD